MNAPTALSQTESQHPAPSASETSLPAGPFYLHAAGEMKPAVTAGQGLPYKVSGLPAFYFWKDAIAVGSYAHPTKGFTLDVTHDTLEQLAWNFRKMKSNGVGVPILMDHQPSAAATLGWIVDIKRDGDRLLELHQFLGEDARDVGLRNLVSLGIDPAFTDGKGTAYGQAIVHSAVTPVPVVPGQGEFEPAEVIELSAAGSSKLVLSLLPNRGVGVSPMFGQTGPSQNPSPPNQTILLELIAAKKQLAVLSGGISSAIADKLFDRLVKLADGSPNLLTLSRDGDNAVPIAAAIFDLLAENRPTQPGERTGHQSLHALSRVAPGADDETPTSIQQRMIALANGVA